jgi:large subunit ribosomal protein L18
MKLSKVERKKFRVTNKLKNVSTKNRYRLSVNRSLKNISAQIIDDSKNVTLASASSNTKEIKLQKKNKKELSALVAEQLVQKAKEMKITKVYFDRGIYKYHGRVKLLAEELRKKGMEF